MCDFRGFRLLGAVRKLTICSAARNFFAGQINAARRKKARRLGVLTIFKQALECVFKLKIDKGRKSSKIGA